MLDNLLIYICVCNKIELLDPLQAIKFKLKAQSSNIRRYKFGRRHVRESLVCDIIIFDAVILQCHASVWLWVVITAHIFFPRQPSSTLIFFALLFWLTSNHETSVSRKVVARQCVFNTPQDKRKWNMNWRIVTGTIKRMKFN